MKYQLRKGDTAFAIGQTNFSESKGSLIDTNGCIALSVISGYAIATINFKKNILRGKSSVSCPLKPSDSAPLC